MLLSPSLQDEAYNNPGALALALLEQAGINSLPVNLHQVVAPLKNIKLLTYHQAQHRLFLPEGAIKAMAAAASTALITKKQGENQFHYLLYQPTALPRLRMELRQQVAMALGGVIMDLSPSPSPGETRRLSAFARHLLCPQSLVAPLADCLCFDGLWHQCLAPKQLCFEAVVNCARNRA